MVEAVVDGDEEIRTILDKKPLPVSIFVAFEFECVTEVQRKIAISKV